MQSRVVSCLAAMVENDSPGATLWTSLPSIVSVESNSSRFISPRIRLAAGADGESG